MDNSIPLKDGTNMPVYEVHPKGKHPAIILLHEIWGLTNNMRDITNRLSDEGYYTLTPDLFAGTPLGDVANPELLSEMNNPDTKDEAQKKMRDALTPMQSPEFSKDMLQKIQACYNYLMKQDDVNGNIAVMGFCFGGTYSFSFAVEQPELKAAIPFYGRPPEPMDKVEHIKCPVLAFYGEQDTGLVDQLPELEQAMEKYDKNFEAVVYQNAGHAFFNDQNKNMYRPEAAEDAWAKTLAFLSTYLGQL